MHTSVMVLALALAAPAANKASPEWLTGYGQAQRLGQTANKPLAVFMAPGKDGWKKLSRDGKVSEEALKQLAEGYVCCFLDTTTDDGKKWAKAFEMPGGLGLVLSDRSGDRQAYRHEGSLDSETLTSTVTAHSGSTSVRTSYYPPETGSSGRVGSTIIQGRTYLYGSAPATRSNCST